ncbi:Glucose oxidase [Leucoagaricus sp. SymC.cos]|nr:Glucose oxidase [Leucoagaricus sp. SymC.cos]
MPLIDLKDATSRTFDYIVVGGGTAGLTLATRLTEDVQTSVLVLEAGEENLNDPLILNMGNYGAHLGRPEYDWCTKTTAQKYSNNTEFHWSRSVDYGFVADIDAWELLGNEGWNWDRFDKYMQRAVTRGTPESLKGLWKKGVQGNGPIQVSHPPLRLDVDIKAQAALHDLGIPFAPAPLDGDPNGIISGPMTADPKTITRSYAANAYWVPNSARHSFYVLTGALAHRLITNEVDGELVITGVEFSHKAGDERIYFGRASKEVILCLGALKTPQILELSGIGRPDVLEKAGVAVRLALEGVGENVQEHINTGVVFEFKDDAPGETFDVLRDPEQAKRHKDLLSKSEGLYTMGISTYAFTHPSTLSDKAGEIITEARKKIEAEIAAGKYSPGLVDQYKVQFDNLDKGVPVCEVAGFPGHLFGPLPAEPGKKYYLVLAALNVGFSRGTIHITTSDPKVQPAMDPHYFEQEIDLKIFAEVVKFCRKVATAPSLKEFSDDNPVELFPGTAVTTDEEIAVALHIVSQFFVLRNSCFILALDTIGSASMLPKEKGGVVDTELKVYGTKNLRIADLSIVPIHFICHSQCNSFPIARVVVSLY